MPFHVQPSFELGLFVFSKEENLAPLKGPRKVLPWLLGTEKASTAHSRHGSIRKQQCKFAQRSRLSPGHTGTREGYKCLGIWKDPCHYRQPWKQKMTQKGDSLRYNIIAATASLRGVYSCSRFSLLFVDPDFTTGSLSVLPICWVLPGESVVTFR